MGNEILFFPLNGLIESPRARCSPAAEGSHYPVEQSQITEESSVDLWDVWGRVVFPLRRSEGSGDRWKSCQREWILGHKCLARVFFSPRAWWELCGSTSFSPLWKLNEKIREAQSTHFLYAKKSRGTCVLKRESFFSLFDCHLNVLASAERSCSHHCLCCRWWVCEHKPTAIFLDLEQMMNYIF